MAQSINVPAIKVLHLIGPQTAVRYARMMGVESPLDPVLSLAPGFQRGDAAGDGERLLHVPGRGQPPGAGGLDAADGHAGQRHRGRAAPSIETHVLQKETVSSARRHAAGGRHRGHGGQGGGDAPGRAGQDGHDAGAQGRLVRRIYAGSGLRGLGRVTPFTNPKTCLLRMARRWKGTPGARPSAPPSSLRFMSQSLPVFRSYKAKEVARLKAHPSAPVTHPASVPEPTTQPPPDDAGAPSDAAPATPAAAPAHKSPPHDNGDGTVTVTVDDATGLLAPDGSAGSHPETFTAGTEPTTLSPQYTVTPGRTRCGSRHDRPNRHAPPAPPPAAPRQRGRDRDGHDQPRRRPAGDALLPAAGLADVPGWSRAARVQPDVSAAARRKAVTRHESVKSALERPALP